MNEANGRPPKFEPIILFTGIRHNERFEILVNRASIELRRSELLNLAKLIAARADDSPGIVPLHRRDVHRLRAAFDATLGRGFGAKLIERGEGPEYYLAIPRDQLHDRIRTQNPFRQLAATGALPPALINTICRIATEERREKREERERERERETTFVRPKRDRKRLALPPRQRKIRRSGGPIKFSCAMDCACLEGDEACEWECLDTYCSENYEENWDECIMECGSKKACNPGNQPGACKKNCVPNGTEQAGKAGCWTGSAGDSTTDPGNCLSTNDCANCNCVSFRKKENGVYKWFCDCR